jgi:hypothetical protein
MMNSIRAKLIISIILLPLYGCSIIGTHVIMQPERSNTWNVGNYFITQRGALASDGHSGIPAKYKCDNVEITVKSVHLSKKTWAMGPPIVPIIPLFFLKEPNVYKRNKLFISYSIPVGNNVDLSKDTVCIVLQQKGENVSEEYCEKPEYDNIYYQERFFSTVFVLNDALLAEDVLYLKFSKPIAGCVVEALSFKKESNTGYFPFLWH